MTSAAHIAAARAAGKLARAPRPRICQVCENEFMGASYAKYCGRKCYNVMRRIRRGSIPAVGIPLTWQVERELTEMERLMLKIAPSPCFNCRYVEKCREIVRRLDETNPPCFEGDE